MTSQIAGSRSRIPAIEGLRGVAVVALIADQVGAASGLTGGDGVFAALVRRLDVGIAILFVVSGFLLYQPFAEYDGVNGTRPSIGRFWWQRLVRLVPPLWLTVAVTFLVTQRSESAADWLRHMTLLQPLSFYYIHGGLAHLWPVSVVVSFAIVVPILGWLASLRARAGAATSRHVIIVIAMIVSAYAFIVAVQEAIVVHRPVLQWLPTYLDWFGAGMLIAVARTEQARAENDREMSSWARVFAAWAQAPGTCWATAALLWLLSATQLGVSGEFVTLSSWQWTLQHLLSGLAAFFVVLPLAFDRSQARRALGRRVPRFLGAMSYGMFLWQLPVLLVVQDRFGFQPFGGNFASQMILTTVGSVLCASASWYFVERPMRRVVSRAKDRRGPDPSRRTRDRRGPGHNYVRRNASAR